MPEPEESPCRHHDEDRIGNLPDEVLVSIISILPIRSLVATSLLSRRWRTLWTHATRLDIDLRIEPAPMLNQLIINTVLTGHQSPDFPPCRIRDPSGLSLAAPTVHRLIPLLTLKHITNLSLDYNCWGHDCCDPYDILMIPTLQQLFLANYYFNQPPPSSDCIRLRSLKLNRANITDNALHMLISSAPLLERLSLIYCRLLKQPHVRSQTLKQLEINDLYYINSLKIDAPELTTLKLNELRQVTDVVINAPSILVLDTSPYVCEKGQQGERNFCNSNVNILTNILISLAKSPEKLPGDASIFANLRKLYISVNFYYEDEVAKLLPCLDNCTNLQELDVINVAGTQMVKSTNRTKMDPFLCLDHLESFWVKGFMGGDLELDFVKFIISKALRLKRVTISSHDSNALGFVKSIMPRAPDLDIITKHDQ